MRVFVPIVRAKWIAPLSQDNVQNRLSKKTVADQFFWNGGRWSDAEPMFVGHIEYDQFAVTSRGVIGNAFSPQARGKIVRRGDSSSEINVAIMPNGGAMVVLGGCVAFLMFAATFVTIRAIQLHMSPKGALVPLGLLVCLYGGGTAVFRSAALTLLDRIKGTLGGDDAPVRS